MTKPVSTATTVPEATTGDLGLDHHLAGRYVQRDDMGEGLFTFVRDGEAIPPSLSGMPVLPAREALEAAARKAQAAADDAAAAAKGSPAS